MTIISFRFLLLLTVCGIVLAEDSQPDEEVHRKSLCLSLYGCGYLPGAWRRRDIEARREIQKRSPLSLRRRDWDDFWGGVAVAATFLPLIVVGKRDTEVEKRKFTNYLARPEVVDRDVEKRIHTDDSATIFEGANAGRIKRDNSEDTNHALITRNNFAFALKRRRNDRRKRIDWWDAAAGAALVGLVFLGRDADENAESKQDRYIQERNQLVEPLADWLQKRDAYESPDSALVTRNNFDSAKKEKRIEALMQK